MSRPLNKQIRVHNNQGVRWLIFDQVETRNGLTPEIGAYLIDLLRAAGERSEVRAVVLGGAHGAFCSGADLGALQRLSQHDVRPELERFQELIRVLWSLDKPTVAAMDGAAAGFGASLALACDLRLGTERACFAWTFSRLGLVTDGGSSWFLPRIVGPGRAYELLYSGRKVKAEESLKLGLLEKQIPGESFAAAVQEEAARLAAGPPLAYAKLKQLMRADSGLEAALRRELEAQVALFATEDYREGLQAVLRKASPLFKGR